MHFPGVHRREQPRHPSHRILSLHAQFRGQTGASVALIEPLPTSCPFEAVVASLSRKVPCPPLSLPTPSPTFRQRATNGRPAPPWGSQHGFRNWRSKEAGFLFGFLCHVVMDGPMGMLDECRSVARGSPTSVGWFLPVTL